MAVAKDLIRERARAAIEAVNRKAQVRAAYLFGSQVTGTADADSDIDIAAFLENGERLGLQQRVRLGIEVREQAGDDIEVHFFPAESLYHPPAASFAAYVVEHGIAIWENHAGRNN